MTKGECSTRNRTTEKNETPTPSTFPGKELSNKTTTREGRPEKETLPLGDSVLTPPKLMKPSAEATQVVAVNHTQVVLPPPSLTNTISDMSNQEPNGELNIPSRRSSASRDLTPPSPESLPVQEQGRDLPTFLPDDFHFPRLQTPRRYSPGHSTGRKEGHNSPAPRLHTPHPLEQTPTPAFVWGPKPVQEEELRTEEAQTGKGKVKLKPSASKVLDLGPITRQGYRTGRLAEDFWTALGLPNLPASTRKTLQVIPFLIKNPLSKHAEYLVDCKTSPPSAITQVHIAELLAGIPWTSSRARLHVVNEISQALHKILIFNNNMSNPFQTWQQGKWFASWGEEADGDNTCTIFVCVTVTDQKVKPRKGQNSRWQHVLEEIRTRLTNHTEDKIAPIHDHQQWLHMAGKQYNNKETEWHNNPASSNVEEPPPPHRGQFTSSSCKVRKLSLPPRTPDVWDKASSGDRNERKSNTSSNIQHPRRICSCFKKRNYLRRPV
jgi:hypothetical protein